MTSSARTREAAVKKMSTPSLECGRGKVAAIAIGLWDLRLRVSGAY